MNNNSDSQPKIYERFGVISVIMLLLAIALLTGHHYVESYTQSAGVSNTATPSPGSDNAHPDGSAHVPVGEHGNAALHILGIVLKESGFAVLVAFFLNLSVEWVNRRRHADQEAHLIAAIDAKHEARTNSLVERLNNKYDETSKNLLRNVFQTVYERYIESSVFEQIDKHVLRKDVMRKHYRLAMEISRIPAEPELVALKLYISYDIVNLTDRPVENVLLGALIDVDPKHMEKCQFARASIGNKEYGAEELEGYKTVVADGTQWLLQVRGEIAPQQHLHVELEYCKVGPAEYSEAICTTVQMDGLELEVVNIDESLIVDTASLHPEDVIKTSQRGERYKTAWKIPHAILPGQGAIIFWHPARDLPAP